MDNKAIGARLLRLRQERRLSQVQFSSIIGVSQPALKNYEYGSREIPAAILLPLFERFGVDPLELLAGEKVLPSQDAKLLGAVGEAVEKAIEASGLNISSSKKWEIISFTYIEAIREGALNQKLISTLVSIGGKIVE